MFKKDSRLLGLSLGLIAPLIGFFIYKYVKFRIYSFKELMEVMRQNPSLITVAVSLSLLANAVIFTLFVNNKKDKTAGGIFIITCIYAIIAILFKFFG
jgi:hypothetical protein